MCIFARVVLQSALICIFQVYFSHGCTLKCTDLYFLGVLLLTVVLPKTTSLYF
jgi:hypothetical protein